MKFLDIGEVAARTGVMPSASRHYEAIGLIASVARHGLRRQFPPEVLLQLKLISMGSRRAFHWMRSLTCSAATACPTCRVRRLITRPTHLLETVSERSQKRKSVPKLG